ncbi:hypothetical protein QTP88_007587 [Uroleucon formosanum]
MLPPPQSAQPPVYINARDPDGFGDVKRAVSTAADPARAGYDCVYLRRTCATAAAAATPKLIHQKYI